MRLLRHLFAPSAHRLFPEASLARIAAAVAAGESRHTGEVCFAVEGGLDPGDVMRGRTARDRAEEVFAHLRVWDTAGDTGVLVYLLLADHAIEIVADRGIAARVAQATWASICGRLATALREGRAEAGVLECIEAVSTLLERHFPRPPGTVDVNELPDRPHLL